MASRSRSRYFGAVSSGEALDKLLDGPGGGWVVGDVDLDEFSTLVSQDQEPEEQAEGEGGDDEEVDGDNVTDMRLKEGAPRRGWPRRGAPHVFGNGEPGDFEAEETKFVPDPAATRGGILNGHAADQRADLDVDRRATRGSGSGPPTPIELESLTVPGEDGRGLDNDEAGPPARPQPGEPYPEDPVTPEESGSTD